jgi:hypothetical protein
MPVRRLFAEDRPRRRPRTDVPLHQQRVALEVGLGRGLHGSGCERDLDALVVDVTVARHAHDHELSRAVEVGEGEHDVLQVCARRSDCSPHAAGASRCAFALRNERGDGRRVR